MTTSKLNIRGIQPKTMILLKQKAQKLNTSVSSLVLTMIKRELGLTPEKPVHNDLDHLAGSWSDDDEKAFAEHTHFFEQTAEES